nr:F-box only protein 8-like [Ipomoea batatas]
MNPSSSTSITSLTREILLKILTGLPAKTAVRFRCTSKFFYSFIPDPRFKFRILVSLPSVLNLYSVRYREDSHGNLQADTAQHLDVPGLLCSADDKMCLLIRESDENNAIFDLSTGWHIWLPNIIGWPASRAPSSLIWSCAVLGFDSVSERYKVFKSMAYYDSGYQRVLNKLWVLTVGVDKSWREIDFAINRYARVAICIHGVIYLITRHSYSVNSLFDSSSKIVAIDLATESFIRSIPFPSECRPTQQHRPPWIKLNGRLGFINILNSQKEKSVASGIPIPWPDRIDIWTLEGSIEYSVILPLEEREMIGEATFMEFTTNSIGEIAFLIGRKRMMSPLLLVYSFGREVWRRFEIHGVIGLLCSADGKMCLLSHASGDDAVFDLSTGLRICLPSIGRSTRRAVLVFDSVSGRYKVFNCQVYFDTDCRQLFNQLWVLTVGVDKSWRKIDSSNITGYIQAVVHIRGIIYLIPFIFESRVEWSGLSRLSKIVAIDVAEESLSFITFIPLPSECSLQWMKLNDRLAFIDILSPQNAKFETPTFRPDKINIWTLERSMEWEKQTIGLPLKEREVIGEATFMGFTANSMGDIVFLIQRERIMSPLVLVYSFRRESIKLQRQMNNPSTSSSSTSITSLPREILLKILTGLPAKSAVRFRCSSKFFYSFIPDPRFAFRILVSLPSKTPPGLNLYSVSYREDSHGNLQADTAQRLGVRGLVCSADGKMCLLSHASGDDAVFDLSTGRHIWLPSHISWSTGRAVLGFDSVSERYKVFNSEVYYDSDRQRYRRGWVPWMKLNGHLAFINILSPEKAKSLSPSGASTSWPNKINIWTLERSMEWEKQTVGLPLEEREVIGEANFLGFTANMRFRCTSKFFYSFIPEPRFEFRILVSLPSEPNLYSVSYREDNHGNLQADIAQRLDVLGLLCSADDNMCLLSRESVDDNAIFDLSTGRHIWLPNIIGWPPSRAPSSLIWSCAVLGFDSVSERYKVFKSTAYYDSGYQRVLNKLWVLTVGVDKSWREIDFAIIRYARVAICINGIIYLITRHSHPVNSLFDSSSKIVAIDLATESFIRIDIWTLEGSIEYSVILPLKEREMIGEATFMEFTTNSIGEIAFLIGRKRMMSPLLLVYSFRREYTSSAVKESGVASFEYLETDGYVKGSALASLVEFPREGINPKLCSSPERILKCLRRCSSKFFYSLIPEPRFAFKILVSLPSGIRPILNLYTVNYSEDSHGNLQADTAQRLDTQNLVCLAGYSSADGKLCLLSDESGHDAVFDLGTRQSISLPKTCHPVTRYLSCGFLCFDFLFTCRNLPGRPISSVAVLGFGSVSGKYKVFKPTVYYDSGGMFNRLWVLTLGVDNSWREIEMEIEIHTVGYTDAVIHVNGTVYLVPRIKASRIAAMDVETERLTALIAFPSEYQPGRPWMSLNGRLAFVNVPKRGGAEWGMEVWTLERAAEWERRAVAAPPEEERAVIGEASSLRFASNSMGEIVLLLHGKEMCPLVLVYSFGRGVWD